MSDFRQFLLRGNLVDTAVGIVVGIAFAAVVTALVSDLLTPLIAAIAGKQDFSGLTFTIHKSRFLYGSFINAFITFVSIAAVVFYFVVKPVNALTARYRTAPPLEPTEKKCPHCLSDIPTPAAVCAFCTRDV